ncbi:MAG TPA: inorganic pyrophosphatase, partial [Oscillatoriales cyanobacterium M59_W2019_021]
MDNFQWQSSELEWVERVRQLCVEIARAALADLPALPECLSQRALPLAEQGEEIADAISDRQGITQSDRSQSPELAWIDRVRQFFLELSRLSLSERPRLPDHLSGRSLDLAEEAQDIQEAAEAARESGGS